MISTETPGGVGGRSGGTLSSSDAASFDTRCLTLQLSRLEDGSQYALWEPVECSQRLQYVCQSSKPWTGERKFPASRKLIVTENL